MDSFLSTLQNCYPWIAIFTSLVFFLSTIILISINQKVAKLQQSNKDEIFNKFSTQKLSRDEEEEEEEEEEEGMTQVVQESQQVEENLKRDTKSEEHGVNQVQIGPPKLHSCSSLSEDSDMEWLYSGNFGQSREYSDDSISDEESLFEITLPDGQQDFSSETIFYQPKLIELFAEINEINEEENLIEIDLSMGSIKCSRFEIKA